MVNVCDDDTGFCTLVFKIDAPTDTGTCDVESIELIDYDTGRLVDETALVCDLTPETRTVCDAYTGVCKEILIEQPNNTVRENKLARVEPN